MLRIVVAALSITLLYGCSENLQPSTSLDGASDTSFRGQDGSAPLGYQVYENHCAACHETGLGDAPVTGEPTDWNDRSQLWMSVLTEHVENGYLSMPARGGVSELTDLSLSKAVEYMMLRTYPEKRRDSVE